MLLTESYYKSVILQEAYELSESRNTLLSDSARHFLKNMTESDIPTFCYLQKLPLEDRIKALNEDIPIIGKLMSVGADMWNKVKGFNLESMVGKISQKIKDFKGEEPDATLIKAAKEKMMLKYQALKKQLGGSDKAAIAVLLGAMVLWTPPIIGTPLVIAYFKVVKAMAAKILAGKEVHDSDLNPQALASE